MGDIPPAMRFASRRPTSPRHLASSIRLTLASPIKNRAGWPTGRGPASRSTRGLGRAPLQAGAPQDDQRQHGPIFAAPGTKLSGERSGSFGPEHAHPSPRCRMQRMPTGSLVPFEVGAAQIASCRRVRPSSFARRLIIASPDGQRPAQAASCRVCDQSDPTEHRRRHKCGSGAEFGGLRVENRGHGATPNDSLA